MHDKERAAILDGDNSLPRLLLGQKLFVVLAMYRSWKTDPMGPVECGDGPEIAPSPPQIAPGQKKRPFQGVVTYDQRYYRQWMRTPLVGLVSTIRGASQQNWPLKCYSIVPLDAPPCVVGQTVIRTTADQRPEQKTQKKGSLMSDNLQETSLWPERELSCKLRRDQHPPGVASHCSKWYDRQHRGLRS